MPTTPPREQALNQRWPLPLAQLFRRAQNAKTALDRHLMVMGLWEAALKLWAAAAVVRFARGGQPDDLLAQRIRKLAHPSQGDWLALVRHVVPVLAKRGEPGYQAIHELAFAGRRRDDLPQAAGLDAVLIEVLTGKREPHSSVRLDEVFDRLVQHRNKGIAHAAPAARPEGFHERLAQAALAGLSEILTRLDVLAGGSLLHVADVRQSGGLWLVQRFELVGETPRRLPALELPHDAADTLPYGGHVYLATSGPELASLHPLVGYDAEANDFYFLNARLGGRRGTEWLSYTSGIRSEGPDLAGSQCALLSQLLGMSVAQEEIDQWASVSDPADDPIPEPAGAGPAMLGDYELKSVLGRGGMGVVYRAWQPSLRRDVALKRLKEQADDSKALDRFRREIRALGRVDHPNLVKVIGAGSDGEHFYYTMELVEGAPLSDVCTRLSVVSTGAVDLDGWRQALSTVHEAARRAETPLSGEGRLQRGEGENGRKGEGESSPDSETGRQGDKEREVVVSDHGGLTPRRSPVATHSSYVRHIVTLMRQTAEAAHALHEAGVLHRDIKPGNILVTNDGERAVLMDLGLAQLADDMEGRLTRTRQFVGTLRYASPEQVLAVGQLDRRSDVYSLGATLWEVLALAPLFGATDQTPTAHGADPAR